MTQSLFTLEDAASLIVPRDPESHKGRYGHGALIAGCCGMAGAAVLAARACMKSGIGLLTVFTPECNRGILQSTVPEAMTSTNGRFVWEDTIELTGRCNAAALGPGLGTARQTAEKAIGFMESLSGITIVADADFLNVAAAFDRLDLLGNNVIITPHPGEFDRLLKCTGISYDNQKRTEQAAEFAGKYGCHVILKGHGTVVASPDGRVSTNTTGNPGMATGGSGDVLTGILLALVAAGFSLWDAARLGPFVHGLAGDLAADRLTQISMTAGDIVTYLPSAWERVSGV